MITPKTKYFNKSNRLIKEKANFAITEWYFGGQETGTFYSKRGARSFRGKQIK